MRPEQKNRPGDLTDVESEQDFFPAIWSGLVSLLVWLGLVSEPIAPSFQGYVEGEFVLVAAKDAGVLTSLSVRRGGRVAAGDAMFELDWTAEAADRDQAAAMLAQARDRLANLTKGKRAPEIDVLEAQLRQAEAQLHLAAQNLERQRRLEGSPAFTQEKLDVAIADYSLQQARVMELKAQLASARMTIGREDELRAARAEVAASEAALAQAQWQLDQRIVDAPVSGLVADTYFDPGETVGSGQPVVSILPPGNLKVRYFVPEALLATTPVGSPVVVRCDGCAADIPARVTYVAPNAEFTPPVLYSRENRNRLVFMVEARPLERAELLRPGQPVDVVLPPP